MALGFVREMAELVVRQQRPVQLDPRRKPVAVMLEFLPILDSQLVHTGPGCYLLLEPCLLLRYQALHLLEALEVKRFLPQPQRVNLLTPRLADVVPS